MEEINEILENEQGHLSPAKHVEVPTNKSSLNKLYVCSESGVKFYDPKTGKMGYMGPKAVEEIKKAKIQPTTTITKYLVGPDGFVNPIGILNNPDEMRAMREIAEDYRNIISP